MRSRPRSVTRSPFLAYLVCFVAGGATIAMATYAYRFGTPLRAASAHAQDLARGHPARLPALAAAHQPGQQEPKRAGGGVAAASGSSVRAASGQKAAPVQPVLIARVTSREAVTDAPLAGDPHEAADPDADEGLSSEPWAPERSDTYRTVCVRLCDGSSTPISFATTRDKFKADAAKCSAGCSSPTQMFYARAGESELEDMIDIHGASYVDLPNAFRFQTSYEAGCTCHGQPWETASLVRHRQFAILAAAVRDLQSHPAGSTRQTLAKGRTTSEMVASSGERPGLRGTDFETGPERRSLAAAAASVPANSQALRKSFAVAAAILDPPAAHDTVARETERAPVSPRLPQVQPAHEEAPLAADKSVPQPPLAKAPKALAAGHPAPVLKSAHPAAIAGRRSSDPKPAFRSVAVRPSTTVERAASRDVLANVRGNARAQREFRTQEYWRLSYWEPR